MPSCVARAESITVIPQSSALSPPSGLELFQSGGALVSPGLSVESGSQQSARGIYGNERRMKEREEGREGRGEMEKGEGEFLVYIIQ